MYEVKVKPGKTIYQCMNLDVHTAKLQFFLAVLKLAPGHLCPKTLDHGGKRDLVWRESCKGLVYQVNIMVGGSITVELFLEGNVMVVGCGLKLPSHDTNMQQW